LPGAGDEQSSGYAELIQVLEIRRRNAPNVRRLGGIPSFSEKTNCMISP